MTAGNPEGERPIRAAEVVGALSLATDLGTGQPPYIAQASNGTFKVVEDLGVIDPKEPVLAMK